MCRRSGTTAQSQLACTQISPSFSVSELTHALYVSRSLLPGDGARPVVPERGTINTLKCRDSVNTHMTGASLLVRVSYIFTECVHVATTISIFHLLVIVCQNALCTTRHNGFRYVSIKIGPEKRGFLCQQSPTTLNDRNHIVGIELLLLR
jgi:hypothetical protein